jgi:hypothetical protein
MLVEYRRRNLYNGPGTHLTTEKISAHMRTCINRTGLQSVNLQFFFSTIQATFREEQKRRRVVHDQYFNSFKIHSTRGMGIFLSDLGPANLAKSVIKKPEFLTNYSW